MRNSVEIRLTLLSAITAVAITTVRLFVDKRWVHWDDLEALAGETLAQFTAIMVAGPVIALIADKLKSSILGKENIDFEKGGSHHLVYIVLMAAILVCLIIIFLSVLPTDSLQDN